MQQIQEEDLKIKLPSNMIISGATSSGKTTWLIKFLRHASALIEPPPKSILYAFGQVHDKLAEIESLGSHVHILNGIPTDEDLHRLEKPALVVLDDLLTSMSKSYLERLFMIKSHHMNLCCVLLTQNLFDPIIKTARQNSHYFVLLNSLSSNLSTRVIGQHLFPRRLDFFMSAYSQATEKKPFGYLFLSAHPQTSSIVRLRTGIFPDEQPVVYLPSKGLIDDV